MRVDCFAVSMCLRGMRLSFRLHKVNTLSRLQKRKGRLLGGAAPLDALAVSHDVIGSARERDTTQSGNIEADTQTDALTNHLIPSSPLQTDALTNHLIPSSPLQTDALTNHLIPSSALLWRFSRRDCVCAFPRPTSSLTSLASCSAGDVVCGADTLLADCAYVHALSTENGGGVEDDGTCVCVQVSVRVVCACVRLSCCLLCVCVCVCVLLLSAERVMLSCILVSSCVSCSSIFAWSLFSGADLHRVCM
jgi:hypothetical protein